MRSVGRRHELLRALAAVEVRLDCEWRWQRPNESAVRRAQLLGVRHIRQIGGAPGSVENCSVVSKP